MHTIYTEWPFCKNIYSIRVFHQNYQPPSNSTIDGATSTLLVRCCHDGLPLCNSMLVCEGYWHMSRLVLRVTNSFAQKAKLCFTSHVDLSLTSLLMYHCNLSFENRFTMTQHSGLLGLVAVHAATNHPSHDENTVHQTQKQNIQVVNLGGGRGPNNHSSPLECNISQREITPIVSNDP